MGRAMPTRTARTNEGASRDPSSPSTSSDDDNSTEKLLCSNHSRGRDRLVWAGRSGTANCEKKRGGSPASAYAAISRAAADPRDVACAAVSRDAADPPDVGPPARGAMSPASTRDAARIAEKRGLERDPRCSPMPFASCRLQDCPGRGQARAHRIDCACGKRCASSEC